MCCQGKEEQENIVARCSLERAKKFSEGNVGLIKYPRQSEVKMSKKSINFWPKYYWFCHLRPTFSSLVDILRPSHPSPLSQTAAAATTMRIDRPTNESTVVGNFPPTFLSKVLDLISFWFLLSVSVSEFLRWLLNNWTMRLATAQHWSSPLCADISTQTMAS